MNNIKMIKSDDAQYVGKISGDRYYLAEVRKVRGSYCIVTGVIAISDYYNQYEEIVSCFYGSAANFKAVYPDSKFQDQRFAEMCFEITETRELSCSQTFEKKREAVDKLDDIFHPRRLYVDMDGTLTVFTQATSEQLNSEGYFRQRAPQTNVLEAIRMMIKGGGNLEVFLIPAVLDTPYAKKEKLAWLEEFAPEIDEDHIIFVPCGENKSHYVPGGVGKYDYLLDDFSVNLREWPGMAIKLKNDINGTKGTWIGKPQVRYDASPAEIKRKLEQYLFGTDTQVD